MCAPPFELCVSVVYDSRRPTTLLTDWFGLSPSPNAIGIPTAIEVASSYPYCQIVLSPSWGG